MGNQTTTYNTLLVTMSCHKLSLYKRHSFTVGSKGRVCEFAPPALLCAFCVAWLSQFADEELLSAKFSPVMSFSQFFLCQLCWHSQIIVFILKVPRLPQWSVTWGASQLIIHCWSRWAATNCLFIRGIHLRSGPKVESVNLPPPHTHN
jgi:hypothetical protein